MKNLKELINLAFANRLGKKSSTPYRSAQDEFEPGYNPMTGRTDLNVNALAKKVRETKFTKEYDDNPALKGGQKDLPDALQKGIINKSQNEHHLKNNPDAKYVATAAPNGWFDVWEGETFDITGENGVLVGKFKTMKDAKDYANIKNSEQGKLEAPKNYLKEDANKIIALEKERERLMADMEQEAEPEGGSTADKYGVKLDRIDKALAKLKGTKKQYKVLSTAELDKLATIKR